MQEIVQETMHGTTEILRGMTSQYAEADDIVIVEDIRSEQILTVAYFLHFVCHFCLRW